jgi:YfiH family protein
VRLGPAEVRFTGRAEGDLGHGGAYVQLDELDAGVVARRAMVCPLPWTWLRQMHGDAVVVVGAPGEGAGTKADAAVTDRPGSALAVLTADCAPVALASDEGVIGVAHAGWKGLLAGVLPRTVEAMRVLGATDVRAILGPCIHAECYEFGTTDLDAVARRLGDAVRGTTKAGAPALDVPAAVRGALLEADVADVGDVDVCTACSTEHWSWRARQDTARQAVVIWR